MSFIRTDRRTLLGGLAGAAASAISGPACAQALQEVLVGMPSTSLGSAPMRITEHLGIYGRHGLTVKITYLDNASVAITALVSGSIKVTQAGPGEMIAAQARGVKIVTPATLYKGISSTLVLSKAVADKLPVKADAPIKDRLKALDGLIIAGASATSAAAIALKGAVENFAGAKIRMVYINQPAMQAALESGAVHGYFASAPFWAGPLAKGNGTLWISGPKGELPIEYSPVAAGVMLAMRDYAEANPEIIRKLVAANDEFVRWLDERPAEVKAAMAKLFPDFSAEAIDLFFASEAPAWKGKLLTEQEMAHEIQFLRNSGVNLPANAPLVPAAMIFK